MTQAFANALRISVLPATATKGTRIRVSGHGKSCIQGRDYARNFENDVAQNVLDYLISHEMEGAYSIGALGVDTWVAVKTFVDTETPETARFSVNCSDGGAIYA